MIRKFIKFTYYWLPPFVWMGIIFYLSSRQRTSITEKFAIDFVIFKGLHMVEYALLYLLFFRSFTSLKIGKNNQINFIYPLIFSIIYAALDEFHQTFVPTREGRIRDVFIDTGGVIIMYIYIKNHLGFIRKFL